MLFCHICGARLAEGARFCSFCGTSVPDEILEQISARTGVTPSASSAAEPIQAPAPEPIKPPEPEPRKAPDPEPILTPAFEPSRPPEPAHSAAPEPNLEPAPQLTPSPEASELSEPETVTVFVTVDEEQIRSRESVLIDDPRLALPLQLSLRPGMKHGTRMRLSNAVFRDTGDGVRRELVVRLSVTEPDQPEQPLPPPPVQPVYDAPQPAAPEPPAPSPSYGGDEVLVTDARCGFILGQPGKVDGYHWGGDDNGYAQIRRGGLSLSKKSKFVAAATGAIGSMIEGKGKDFLSISRAEVLSFRKVERKRLMVYYLSLASGQELKLYFVGDGQTEKNAAMDLFLRG